MQPRRGLAEQPGLGGEVWCQPMLADTVLMSAAQARRGQRPAVAGAWEEHRQDRQYRSIVIGRLLRRTMAGPHLDPAERRGDQLRAIARERRGHLKVGVVSGERSSQQLQYGRLAEHDAGV